MLVAGFTSSLSGCRHWFFHRRVRYPQFSFSLLSPTYLGLYYPRVQLRCFCHQLGIRCVRICVWSRQRYDTLPPRKVGCVSRTNGQPIDGILWPLSGEGAYVWFGLFSAHCRVLTLLQSDGIELMIIITATLVQALARSGPAVNIIGVIVFWIFIVGIGVGGGHPLSAVITSEFASKRIRGRLMIAVFTAEATLT